MRDTRRVADRLVLAAVAQVKSNSFPVRIHKKVSAMRPASASVSGRQLVVCAMLIGAARLSHPTHDGTTYHPIRTPPVVGSAVATDAREPVRESTAGEARPRSVL